MRNHRKIIPNRRILLKQDPCYSINPCGNSRKFANLQKKKIFVPELDKTFTLTLSTKAIKTIQKNGAYKTLKDAGII